MLPEALIAFSLLTHVVQGPCPGVPMTAGCYVPPPVNVVYVEDQTDRWTEAHELGHAADYLRLTDGERHRISCHPAFVYAWNPPPCGKSWAHLRERFADAFATCYLRLPKADVLLGSGYGYDPATMRRHRNLCRLIARAVSG